MTSSKLHGAHKIFLCFFFFLGFFAGPSHAQDNLIVHPKRVGAITARSTEEELAKLYGKENLSRRIRPWEESYRCATVLYSDTNKELNIFWREEDNDYGADPSPEQKKRCQTLPLRQAPVAVSLSTNFEKNPIQKPTYWKTPEGVFVGMSLLELEKINGAPIEFDSSASCFDGGIMKLNGGKLEKLKELLAYSRLSYPLDELESMKKSGAVSSKELPKSLKKKIFLDRIEFSFPNFDQ